VLYAIDAQKPCVVAVLTMHSNLLSSLASWHYRLSR